MPFDALATQGDHHEEKHDQKGVVGRVIDIVLGRSHSDDTSESMEHHERQVHLAWLHGCGCDTDSVVSHLHITPCVCEAGTLLQHVTRRGFLLSVTAFCCTRVGAVERVKSIWSRPLNLQSPPPTHTAIVPPWYHDCKPS